MAKASKLDLDNETVRIARTLLSTPPKLHGQMKIGKPKRESAKSPEKRKPVKK